MGDTPRSGRPPPSGRQKFYKLANIVLLDENPLNDVGERLTIWRVVQGGRVLPVSQSWQKGSNLCDRSI